MKSKGQILRESYQGDEENHSSVTLRNFETSKEGEIVPAHWFAGNQLQGKENKTFLDKMVEI